MSLPEKELFDVDEVAPRLSPSERNAAYRQTFENTARLNLAYEISRKAPYLVEKLASLAVDKTIKIHGVELPNADIVSQPEA
jgi:hypothetical protein